MKIDHLIDGRPVEGRAYFETVNPATQEVLAEVAAGGEAEVNAAVAAAKAAFPKWAGTPATERAKLMRKLGDLIAKHVPEIAQTETRDTGQVIAQTGKQLVPRAADNFHYFAEMCTRVDGHTYPTPTHLNYTLFHPVGVCALISPWNVPFMTATWKVAPCLAFGNTAVLKMSELSPLTAARLGELALEAGIPPGVLNLVHGYGQEAGEPLVAHPDVRAISFTGSTATGNRIVKAAGLKKFSMELGGKSPFVIFDDADLDRALDAAVFMIFSNNGERCTAGSRILVQQNIYADFAQKFAERARKIAVGDPLDEKTIVGPMISQGHLAKVRSYIELGPQEGATLLCGGLDVPAQLNNGNYVMPTVFADVDNRMRIAQEEIFGPVACLIPFRDEAHAIELANDIAYGLSSYVWTENIGKAHRVAAAVEAGMCFVNSQNVRDLRQPFGGTKASGTGREGGTWSYEVFCEPKNVAVSLGSHHIPHWGGLTMGKLALAAKITHVPSMYLSEFPGPNFGCRDAAINGHKEIDRRCRELGVDTIVVFDVHWQVNSEYHINCGPQFSGTYTSNELPHFIKNMPYAYPGNPALGHLIGDMANAMGVKSRAHSDTTLELEYGTLVPMRYMNSDQHYKVISVSGWCDWHDLRESGRFGLAVRRAIEERYDGTVAVFASGSLSHHFADNGRAPEFMHKVYDPFLEQVDHRVVELWKQGDWKTFLGMLPMYAEKCWGEGDMHDTAMLLGLLGWDSYEAPVEIITPYFGSSGTGQINAIFPVTPLKD